MHFNPHFEVAGRHAFLSASKYHWVNDDENDFDNRFRTALAAQKGTELHDLAANLIKHRVKLQGNKTTLARYVNDAIGYRMTPEQILFYSMNAFGTADAISFRNNHLRIHDLKTGVSPASMKQLEVYTAFFCLEYHFKPFEIETELRIYQNDEVTPHFPDPDYITHLMDLIVIRDKRVEQLKSEEL